MKRCTKIHICMMLIIVVGSITDIYSTSAAAEKNIKSINFVDDAITGINTYHANLIARMYPSALANNNSKVAEKFDYDNFMEVKSTIFGESGKRMKLVTQMKSSEYDTEVEATLIYDGTWLWVQTITPENPKNGADKTNYTAMKIHIPSVSPDPVNEPFNTLYGVSGAGLQRNQDLPGTLAEIVQNYDLKNSTSLKRSNKLIFEGHLKPDQTLLKSEGASKRSIEFAKKLSKYCKLWVSKETGLITSYSMGQSEERPTIITDIEYLSVNEILPEDIFKYNPPEDVVVNDITSTILEYKKELKEKMSH